MTGLFHGLTECFIMVQVVIRFWTNRTIHRDQVFFILVAFSFSLLGPTSAKAENKVGELRAIQITAANAVDLIQQGPDAAGGIGDWLLSNGTLCAVISNIDHESDLSAKGGVLIDLGYCDRADDQYVAAQDLLDGSRKKPIVIDRIDTAIGASEAAVITFGGRGDVVVETRYRLNSAKPNRLLISKRIQRVAGTGDGFGVYVPVGFNYHSMESFVFNSRDLRQSNGFKQEDFVDRGIAAFGDAARNADTIITLSPRDSVLPISYGWRLKSATKSFPRNISSAERQADILLPSFVLADFSSTAFLVLSDDFVLGSDAELGMLQLAQLAMMSLEKNEIIKLEEEIFVAADDDVASITDLILENTYDVMTKVDDVDAVVHVELDSGIPVTHVHPNSHGDIQLKLPNGKYLLRVAAKGGRKAKQKFTIQGQSLVIEPITLAKASRILIPQGEAMRLVFKGLDGALDPDFQNPLTGFTVSDDKGERKQRKVSSIFLAGIESDVDYVDVVPGRYQVYATRGIEHSVELAEILVTQSETVALEIAVPRREIQTPGFIASDFHVHSGPSMDNAFSTVERLRTFVAEHGEVMVASEHDTIYDFTPQVIQLKLQKKIVVVTGTEMTSEVPTARMPHTIGHANFFPVKQKPLEFRRGAPNGENRRLREVIYEMKRENPDVISQLNHARESSALSGGVGNELPDNFMNLISNQSYLDHMGPAGHPYQADKPLDEYPNKVLIESDPVTGVKDLDFDLMEVMNGAQGNRPDRVTALRTDWLSFVKQGHQIKAAANSDSHTMASQVGLPRNMVAVTDDSLGQFDIKAFSAAIRQGNLYGTTGPVIELQAGLNMGDMLSGENGEKQRFAGKVKHASWIDVDQITVQVNGETISSKKLDLDGNFSFDLNFVVDSFVTFEVEGEAGEIYQAVYPGFSPYAFTNPIYIDANGDGQWQPPGM
ncbi:MAG: hypothetical protein ACI9CE_001626 [Flavobacterium sp.]|jgi:hypothetical protein